MSEEAGISASYSVKRSTRKYCIVPKCKNTSRTAPNKIYFVIPRGKAIRKKWCCAMKRDKKNVELSDISSLYCCEDHFNFEDDLENYMEFKLMKNVRPRLKKGVLPHVFTCQNISVEKSHVERGGTAKRQRLQWPYNHYRGPTTTSTITISHLIETDATLPKEEELQHTQHKSVKVRRSYRNKGKNTKIASVHQTTSPSKAQVADIAVSPIKIPLQKMQKYVYDNIISKEGSLSSSKDNSFALPSKVSSSDSTVTEWREECDTDSFKEDMCHLFLVTLEKNPKLFLGLPPESYHLIKILTSRVDTSTLNILITLKKIRLDDPYAVLAVHFGLSVATISHRFRSTLMKLAKVMQELAVWPPAERIKFHLPIPFRARYYKVVSIIDCLEIQIEKPSNPVHQALTWSQYKNCNTIKYLISCTPDGLVNYISEGYSGRATDVEILKDCGYLDKLSPGEYVMVDRGFKNITSLLQQRKCTLVRPPSVSAGVQRTREEVKQSKRIAALRIHVERVIGRLREFNMLQPHACIDHNLIQYLDFIIIVACGIINMQDHIIKMQV